MLNLLRSWAKRVAAERNKKHAFSRESENAAIAARIIADDNAITTNICAKLRESGAVIYRRL
jgi:hypothetical protein